MKGIIVKLKNFAKGHFYAFALLLLALFFFHNIISSAKILDNIHYINDVTFYSYNMREAVLKQHTLPLWTPYYYGGRPLFAQPEYYFVDFNFLLLLLTGNIYLAMNFSAIIHLFLAGAGMYLLALFLSGSRKAAFISALIYMFNGYVHTFVVPGNIMVLEGYSLVPFILLFTIKALKEKDFVFSSVTAGIFAAFQIFVGGVIYLPYIFLLIAAYSFIYILNKNILNRILKLAIVGTLIFTAGFGLSAIKLLPGIEFMKLSNRAGGLPYEEYVGAPIELKNFIFTFVTNVFSGGTNVSAAVGIAGFILGIFGLYRFRSRAVIFLALAVILSLLMSAQTFLTKIFYNIPIFNQIRHIERSVFLFAFASSILAGLGFVNLQLFFEKFKKIKVSKNAVFLLVAFAILFELLLIQKAPQSVNVVHPEEIPVLGYISDDASAFRTMNLALSTLIGASGYNYYSQLGIGEIKGGSGIWFNDYLGYLIVAQNMPAKLWGILNNKYVVLGQNTSIDGLSYVEKFKDCKGCVLWEAWGPYLYKNTKYLPRYYMVPNSILVVGDSALVKQLIYSIMLQNFEPGNTVLIEGTKINDYGIDFLTKFGIIFLVEGSVDQDSIGKLKEYAAQGGIIVPDILNGKGSITNEDINAVLNETQGNYTEINIENYSNNKVALGLEGKRGWLVASERFAHFQGWEARANKNNVNIFKADNVISAVYLDGGEEKLIFEYKPASYKRGKLISLIAVIVLLAYFGHFAYAKKLKSGGSNQA